MTVLVRQRTPHDCVLCCIAMALGLAYEDALARLDGASAGADTLGTRLATEGCHNQEDEIALRALGLRRERDFQRLVMSPHYATAGFLRNVLWGRRAILSVRSKNIRGHHAIYWDGAALLDPSTFKTFEWQEVEPIDLIIFRESAAREDIVPALVDVFLAWPLPESVCSDLCAAEQRPGRSGTNLLTADEARQMFEHVLARVPLKRCP